MNFILSKNESYSISDKSDLNELFINLKDFKLSDEDIKDEHEALSITLFIASLSKLSLLKFPFFIHWSESPDFRLEFTKDSMTIGLEHVRATLAQYKMANREFSKRPNGSFLEPSYYSPFKKLAKREAFAGIRNPGEELKGNGWDGDIVEIEWADIITQALINKTDLLNKKHFLKYEYNHLLIEDDSPVDLFRNLATGLKYLKQSYKRINWGSNKVLFDKVHILSIHDFIFDVFNKCLKVDISKKGLGLNQL